MSLWLKQLELASVIYNQKSSNEYGYYLQMVMFFKCQLSEKTSAFPTRKAKYTWKKATRRQEI